MASAVFNQVFSVPLRHFRSTRLSSDQVLTESTVRGLFRYIGDSENEILRYLTTSQSLLQTDWPLLLFGPSGTGKTTLALTIIDQLTDENSQSLALDVENHSPRIPVVFTAADFVRRFHSSIETNSVPDFRNRIVESAALFIDNVQLLAEKPGAQDELIYLLDEMANKGTPVVLTSLDSPGSTSKLSAHLVSRLSAGLSLELRLPGPEARTQIIAELADIHGLEIREDAIGWLADRFNVTVPRLNQLFTQLKSQILATQKDPDLDLTFFESLLKQSNKDNNFDTTKSVIQTVAREFQLKSADIKSDSRKQSVVLARGVAIYLCRSLLNSSFTKIGKSFGNRDHSTVMHAYNKIRKIVESETETSVQKTVKRLQGKLSNLFAGQLEFTLDTENKSKTGWI